MKQMIQEYPVESTLDPQGREVPDPTPMAPPIGYKRTPSLAEQIREMVRSERLAMEAAAAGFESFEEADDFEVGDDFDPSSPYEEQFEPTPIPELKRRRDAASSTSSQAKETKSAGDQPASATGSASDGPVASDPAKPASPAPKQ